MQTFLPYKSFERSAKVLDRLRLGKQRIEAWQIFLALTTKDYGWKNHPAVKMWKGYEKALLEYGYTICREWKLRGYKDSMMNQFILEIARRPGPAVYPPWLGKRSFHTSHQSNLVRKDKKHYRQYFPKVSAKLEYVWPISS